MRLLLLASVATLIGGGAFAQSMLGQSQPGQSVVAVPPAPPVVSGPSNAPEVPVGPQSAPPPGLVQTPFPPSGGDASAQPNGADAGNADNGNASPVQAVSPSAGPVPANNNSTTQQPAPADTVSVPVNTWVAGQTAKLGVLNKIDGSTRTITIPVGGQANAGDLTVSVQACEMRPPGVLPDAAVFITLQSNAAQNGGGQVYRGWMVHSAPGATDAGDAGEAFRVITCS
ncbi:MAG: DUF2155 domain-containing protein [Rhodospirillales bacterium]|nr:DUF2155 domain-containing protein [Rhodospirillales bacterium]